MKYLTEKSLGEFLTKIFKTEFIHDKVVPNSNIKNRPDYRNDDLMLIVEFDGYLHYTQPKTILTDSKKDKVYTSMGYKVVRIPYFVQISTEIIKILFNEDIDIEQEYPHGFIDPKCILPAEFCSLGTKRYNEDLVKFGIISSDIEQSLYEKVEILKEKNLVYPIWKEVIWKSKIITKQ